MLARQFVSRISSLSNTLLRSTKCVSRVNSFAFSNVTTWNNHRDYTPSNKKYLQPWEVERKEYVELSQAIQSVYSCKMLGEVLKDNL